MANFFSKLFGIFKKSPKTPTVDSNMDPRDIPAHMWPEVQTFIQSLKEIVAENTIEDKQARRMNDQIIQYLEEQIEKKGYSGTYEEKCQSMEMIADRVLTTTVPKFVGAVEKEHQTTEFSDLVRQFKHDIQKKRESFAQQTTS